jgi:hypothetical protein
MAVTVTAAMTCRLEIPGNNARVMIYRWWRPLPGGLGGATIHLAQSGFHQPGENGVAPTTSGGIAPTPPAAGRRHEVES